MNIDKLDIRSALNNTGLYVHFMPLCNFHFNLKFCPEAEI
jgi:hypothetical protein